MPTRSAGQNPITPYFEPERFIHQTLRKEKKQNPFIPIEDRVLKTKYPPFENLFEADVVCNPFLDLPFPMADDQPIWGNNQAVAPTPGAAIVAVDLGDNFTVKGHHLSMIKDRQFDGRSRADPHMHIAEFVKVCGMFCYGDTNVDAIKLKLFPSSLAGEAKIWTMNHNPNLLSRTRRTNPSYLRHQRNFPLQTPNEAHQLLEDRVLLKLDWSKENKAKPLRKAVAFAESDENSPLLEKMEALTIWIDSQFKEIRGDMKEIRDGCNKCGGPHPSSDSTINLWEDPKRKKQTMHLEDIEEIIMFYNLKTKVKQGKKNHQAAIQDLETKFGKIFDHQSSRPSCTLPSNTQTNPKPSTSNEKPYRLPPARNEHVNVVLTRSGKTYNPPANPTKTPIYLNDSEDKAEEVEKEAEPLPKIPTQTDTPPLKAYKPKIPYPQCLNKEKLEARYSKFLDMIKEVRINVPLIEILAGMPNYGKFLKDLVCNKSKMEQISAAFLIEECSAILQKKIPSKLGDPKSFLIPYKFANSVEYLALADLDAVFTIRYTFWNNSETHKDEYSLANHTYQYPMGVAENMLVQVGKFVFPVDFVILQMEEDDKVPLILGRPEDRATFHIDKAMQHSHVNDDTCFRMDVIKEITEDELDDLLDDSKPFLNTSKKISETPLDKEFNEFMSGTSIQDPLTNLDKETPPKDELRIWTSIQDPLTNLEMKPLPKHLKYAFLEENSLLPVVISALLE
nr:reverse transcriptase domain-containing protein [Tanacetum cinerariifolium]